MIPFPDKLADFKDDTFTVSGLWSLAARTVEELYEASNEAFQNDDPEMGQMYQDEATGVTKLLHLVLAATVEHNVAEDDRVDGGELIVALQQAIQFMRERLSAKAYGHEQQMDA